MSDQHEHPTDDQADTEAHLYIPKDERAGGADAEGHGRFRPQDADVSDAEGHKRMRVGRVEDADEGDTIDDAEGHKRMIRRLDDADEGDMVDDTEGHGRRFPHDPVNEPSAIRGRDGKGRR